MKEPLFTGVCTALVTPFLNGQVNYPMMEILLKRQLEAGVRAVVIAGTTGEAPTLSDHEKIQLFKMCKEYIGGKMTLIAGTGSNCTAHTVALSQEAEQAGADALLVVSPYYNKPNPDGLIRHYMAVAESVSIPVILYNVPSRTATDIPVEVYRELSRVGNIVGVKEASADISKITKVLSVCGPDFTVWTGNDSMITPAIALGAKGVISVLSNISPEETRYMTDAALSGDLDTAAALQTEFAPLTSALFAETNPIPVKAAMKLLGFDCGPCRLPLGTASGKTLELLRKTLT